MAKLSHKITNGNNNSNDSNNQNKKLGFTLSTKVDNENEIQYQNNQNQEKTEQFSEKLIETPISISQIIEKIGIDKFGSLTKADFEKLFPLEGEVDINEIKKQIVQKVVKAEIANELGKYAEEVNKKYSDLVGKYKELDEKTRKQEIQVKNLTMQVDDAEEQLFKTEKKYADTVPVGDLIDSFLKQNFSNEYTHKISELLKEGYKNGGRNGAKFTYGFLKGFVAIEETIINLGSDEKENLDLLHEAGKSLLGQITELTVPERRPILDVVANMFNSYLHTYDFVSPEQTLQIDPTIHNAEGLGGSVVKEGLSFAVVRRETRKTVFYAEISTR